MTAALYHQIETAVTNAKVNLRMDAALMESMGWNGAADNARQAADDLEAAMTAIDGYYEGHNEG